METFVIFIGANQRKLNIEPQLAASIVEEGRTNKFKIYSADNVELLERAIRNTGDVPVDDLLGTMTIKSEKDFTFEGDEPFSGEELMGIAAQIIRHPTFAKPNF
jgi:hypothetical protein